MSQGDKSIYDYSYEFCKAVEDLEAIAPDRTTNREILADFLNGLTDENIRRAITLKIDVDTDTLATAMEVIKTDIRESKRKITKAQESNDRFYPKIGVQSSIPSGYDDSFKKRAFNAGGLKNDPYQKKEKPAWMNIETKNIFAYRMYKGHCIRCGSSQHKATARPGFNDPLCPLKHEDFSKRLMQPEDLLGLEPYVATTDYYLTWEAKKLKKEVQGVADHSRLHAQKKY
jgi:hypothetical protein